MMFSGLRKQWRDLTKIPPGKRFQNRNERRKERRRKPLLKAAYLVMGAALLIVGIVLMPAPGPGFLVAFVGAAMLAEESLLAARAFDWLELKLRALFSSFERAWKRARDRRALFR
jgi:uncharacterized protein (TIGR02611 family)